MPCIVFEFMECGDLTEVLRTRSPWKQMTSYTYRSSADKINSSTERTSSSVDSNESSTSQVLTRVGKNSFTSEIVHSF